MANAKVTVGCKLPNGLVLEHKGISVTLAGSNSSAIIGMHGLTPDVDEDWFNDWLVNNLELPLVANDIIFANTAEKAGDEAKEKKGVKTGLEPVDPDKPGEGIEKRKDD